MALYEIGAFYRFCVFPKNLRKAVALCGVMWRYEIGAFSRFLRFSYPQVLGRGPGPNILDPFLGGLKWFALGR